MDHGATRRLGNFEILEKIGQGGMGEVFKARQLSMDRIVALKILPPQLAADQAFVGRFLREARSAGQISHPNLIQVFDCGTADDYFYICMEYVPGRSLRQLHDEQGPLGEADALRHMSRVAAALSAAHTSGIVHCDVKPENILLDAKGEPKLADLGLAKPMSGANDITLSGMTLGTPLYMSPEQAMGMPIDGRSDLYSLGATFFHLLSGEPLFDGPTCQSIAVAQATQPPRPIRGLRPEISPGLEQVLLRVLRKKPEERHRCAQDLIDDLARVGQGRMPALDVPAVNRQRRTRRATSDHLSAVGRKRSGAHWWVIGGGLVLAGLVLVCVFAAGPGPATPLPATTAPASAPPPALVPKTMPKVATPAPTATANPGAAALAGARALLASQPQAFAQARERFLQARNLGAGTAVAAQAEEAITALDRAWGAAALTHWTEIAVRARAESEAGRYDQALALIKGFDPALAARVQTEPAALAARILAAGTEALDHCLDQAEQQLSTDPPAPGAAGEALRKAGEVACAQARTAAAGRIQDLEARIKTCTEAQAGGLAVWQSLEGQLLDALSGEDPTAATTRAEQALQDRRMAPWREQLQAVVAVARACKAWEEYRSAAIAGRKGQAITLSVGNREVAGVVEDTDSRGVRIAFETRIGTDVARGKTTMRWQDLTPGHLVKLGLGWKPVDQNGWVALNLIATKAGDAAIAAGALSAAAGHPLAEPLAARLLAARIGAAEAAAELAWRSLRRPSWSCRRCPPPRPKG